MNSIFYSLTPVSSEFTGGQNVFRANVKTNGTIDAEAFARLLADKTKQDASLVRYFLAALDEELARQMLLGNRVNLGQLATNFAIRGSFRSEDDRFDPERHTLVATVRTLDPLKAALASIKPENICVSLDCSVFSLMDMVTKEVNTINGTNELHLQGVNLGISADNADEGVSLVNAAGESVADAQVTFSDAQTITCSFKAVEPGDYTLVVSARNGNRTTLAPAVAKVKVTVKSAAAA